MKNKPHQPKRQKPSQSAKEPLIAEDTLKRLKDVIRPLSQNPEIAAKDVLGTLLQGIDFLHSELNQAFALQGAEAYAPAEIDGHWTVGELAVGLEQKMEA